MSTPKYEVINSPSELRLKIYGATPKQLFVHALQAMFESAEPIFVAGQSQVVRHLNVHARDLESLLVDFLSEALTLSDIHDEAYDTVRIDEIDDRHVKAELRGHKVRALEIEIKAVTHHDVHIVEKDGAYSTELVLDI